MNKPVQQTDEQVKKYYQELLADKSLKVATFAGGCFWCIEAPLQATPGVKEAITGYAGGKEENPSYWQVVNHETSHREAAQVFYDPQKVAYEDLLRIFWRQIDPTDDEGQFADRGEQYRTAIFYHNAAQKKAAEESKAELEKSAKFKKPIVTEILPLTSFYPAEAYHQDFYEHSAMRYQAYKHGSGRAAFIKANN